MNLTENNVKAKYQSAIKKIVIKWSGLETTPNMHVSVVNPIC